MIGVLATDTYSQNLPKLLASTNELKGRSFVSVETDSDFSALTSLIVTPSVSWAYPEPKLIEFFKRTKEREIPLSLWIDWSHIQYEGDLSRILEFRWETIFSSVPKSQLPWQLAQSTGRWIELESPALLEGALKFQLLSRRGSGPQVFLSQPLAEDRGNGLDQRALFAKLAESTPHSDWVIILHPRESLSAWMGASGTHPVLPSFKHFLRSECSRYAVSGIFGYNTVALLEARLAGHEVKSARLKSWAPNRLGLEEITL